MSYIVLYNQTLMAQRCVYKKINVNHKWLGGTWHLHGGGVHH